MSDKVIVRQPITISIRKVNPVRIKITQAATGAPGAPGPQGDPATNLVTSVAGRIGVVVLVKDDVGLANVDNTSDINKPISTAVQTVLDAKEVLSNKSNSTSLGTSTTLYPTQNAVKVYIDSAVSGINISGYLPKSAGNAQPLTGTLYTRSIQSTTDLTYDLGSSSFYYNNVYARRNYFNSTAWMDGTNAGLIDVVGTLRLPGTTTGISGTANSDIFRVFGGGSLTDGAGILLGGSTNGAIANRGVIRVASSDILNWTTLGLAIGGAPSAATHSVTLQSVSSGISAHNQVDQTTNFEYNRRFWSSNTFFDTIYQGGTGQTRAMRWGTFAGAGNAYIQSNTGSPAGLIQIHGDSSISASIINRITGTMTASSGLQYAQSVQITVNGSGTQGYIINSIDVAETTTGSGAKSFADWKVGGVTKFNVDNTGKVTAPNVVSTYVSSTAPASPSINDLWVVI